MDNEFDPQDPLAGYFDVADTAQALGVGRATVDRMFSDGRLAGIKHAGRRYVHRTELEEYMGRLQRAANQQRVTNAETAQPRKHRAKPKRRGKRKATTDGDGSTSDPQS